MATNQLPAGNEGILRCTPKERPQQPLMGLFPLHLLHRMYLTIMNYMWRYI